MNFSEIVLWVTTIISCSFITTPQEHGENLATEKKRPFRRYSTQNQRILAKEYSDIESMKMFELNPMLIQRVPGTSGNERVQMHIKERLGPLGWKIEEDPFEDDTPYGRKSFNNIIVTFPRPYATQRLVLACHFDSKDMSREKIEFIGATDSAVPCAILLDTAKQLDCLLRKIPEKAHVANLTVQLLFLDGEEAFVQWNDGDSIYGARHLAKRWQKEDKLDSITDFVLLDLIGTKELQFHNFMQETSWLYTELVKIEKSLFDADLLIRKKTAGGSANQFFRNIAHRPGGIQDDHVPFMKRDVSILHLISFPFPSVWHTKEDTLDALDFPTIDDFSRIFRTFVAGYLHLNPSGCRKKLDTTSDKSKIKGNVNEGQKDKLEL